MSHITSKESSIFYLNSLCFLNIKHYISNLAIFFKFLINSHALFSVYLLKKHLVSYSKTEYFGFVKNKFTTFVIQILYAYVKKDLLCTFTFYFAAAPEEPHFPWHNKYDLIEYLP